jgi:dipeptidyl aminopeptidase/acylaminoacyl peptidase
MPCSTSIFAAQWGLATQDDVLDGVKWAAQQAKVADPKRIAIMGASFGGFLAVNSVTVAPQRFACAVASGATVDLSSFVEKVVASFPDLQANLYESVGDVRLPAVKAALVARSAFANLAQVRSPILITHGARDKTSPFEDMEAYAEALHAKGAKVAFVVYPEEAHGFANPQTQATHYGIVEHFLAACLGGKAESVDLSAERQKIDIRFGEANFSFLKNSKR